MNKLLIALIAGTFAATVGAQVMNPSPATKDKQKEVDAATKASTDTAARQAQEQKGVADAKAAKGTPKDLATKQDKQKAVNATTAAASTGATDRAQEQKGVADAKAAKNTPKALPTKQDKQKAVDASTKANASQ